MDYDTVTLVNGLAVQQQRIEVAGDDWWTRGHVENAQFRLQNAATETLVIIALALVAIQEDLATIGFHLGERPSGGSP